MIPDPTDLRKKFQTFKALNSYFLTFEGIEGAGKSTHIKALKNHLESVGYRVIILREPGGTKFGEKLREAILQSETPLHPLAEAHLFASSRAQLLFEVTLKELEIPKTIVIYDRYIDSSFAYQGHGCNLGIDTIIDIHSHYPLNILPNLTLYIEISLETSLYRQRIRDNQKDYFESQDTSFYQKLIEGYKKAIEYFPERIQIINGEKDVEGVFEEILSTVNKLISHELNN